MLQRTANNFSTRTSSILVAAFLTLGSLNIAHSADEDTDMLREKLAEAERLLEENKSSHEETAEKKRLIDERLAAQQKREAELKEELEALCAEQDQLSPGTLDSCLAKIDN